jgi:hypothetical protein
MISAVVFPGFLLLGVASTALLSCARRRVGRRACDVCRWFPQQGAYVCTGCGAKDWFAL